MKKFLIIFVLTFAIFIASGRGVHAKHHFFVPLAEAFLNGRLYVDEMKPELHEMIPDEEVKTGIYTELVDFQKGKYFVIFPPFPAVMLMPVVAFWGEATNQSIISMIIASLSVAVSFFVFAGILKDEKKALWMTILYGFGSMLWYHAVSGSGWYFAQVCALLFIWLAILEVLNHKRIWIIGILVGLAYLCRFPAILSLPFFVYLTYRNSSSIKYKRLFELLSLVSIFVGISLLYNWLRYGHIGHYGYTLLELRPYNISNEYSEGSYSPYYIARNLKAMFWTFPERIPSFPFLSPNTFSMALWFVFPAIFIAILAPFKKNSLALASVIAIAVILPSMLLHGGVGASQFGYRYALDFMPFILILISLAIKVKFYLWQKTLIVLGILINFWGICFIFWR